MADFSSTKKYNYLWNQSKFKDLSTSGSNISQFINDAGYITSADGIDTGSFVTTSSFNHYTGSSLSTFAGTASFALTASYFSGSISNAIYADTASYALTASYFSGSISNAITADTASYVNPLNQNVYITGGLFLTSSHISTVDYIDFTPLSNGDAPSWLEGRMWYDTEQGAVSIYNGEADITLQVGQEEWIRVYNNTGVTISDGTPVRISGSQGDNPYAWPAISQNTLNDPDFGNHIIGIATHNIENNSVGYITSFGIVRGIDTTAFTEGSELWLQTGSAGLRDTKPPFPYDVVQVGFVVKSAANGFIFVKPKEPIHLHDISGLSGSNGSTPDGALWVYQSSSQAWYNTTVLPNITATGSFTGSFTGNLTGTASYALSSPLPPPYNFISTGSISASVSLGDNLFLISSASMPLFTVSSSGVTIFNTQSSILSNPAPYGGLYFTSESMYIGLEP